MQNILQYLSTLYISQNVRKRMHNLRFRLEKVTDQTIKAKKYQLVGIPLSINDNTKSSQT